MEVVVVSTKSLAHCQSVLIFSVSYTVLDPADTTTTSSIPSTPTSTPDNGGGTSGNGTAGNNAIKGSSHTGAIAGGVAGGGIILLLAILALFLLCRKRRKEQEKSSKLVSPSFSPAGTSQMDQRESFGNTLTSMASKGPFTPASTQPRTLPMWVEHPARVVEPPSHMPMPIPMPAPTSTYTDTSYAPESEAGNWTADSLYSAPPSPPPPASLYSSPPQSLAALSNGRGSPAITQALNREGTVRTVLPSYAVEKSGHGLAL